jgi:hypothetical protein
MGGSVSTKLPLQVQQEFRTARLGLPCTNLVLHLQQNICTAGWIEGDRAVRIWVRGLRARFLALA